MAKASSGQAPTKIDALADIPHVFFQHHGKTLFGPMKEWKSRGHVPPVLLLTGQSGIGKRTVAYFLAQWILCEKNGINPRLKSAETASEVVPCGECPSCKKVLAGNEVDLTEIVSETEGESDPGTGSLKIEQFRKLRVSAGFGAHEGPFRIILIPSADRMTVQAANSVLKLLEETPPRWLFFLTASDPSLMLPTLVSRCQVLRLKPFSSEELAELLKTSGVSPEKIPLCSQLSQGSWKRALRFASEEVWKQRKVLLQFLNEPPSVLLSLIDWAAQEESHFEMMIDFLEQFTAEMILWSVSSKPEPPENYPWIQSDAKVQLAAHAHWAVRQFGSIANARAFWMARAERLNQVRHELLAPLNRKLLAQDLLIPWLGAKA